MTSHQGRPISSVPPCNSLVSVLDPWRAFLADTVPFKAFNLALCIVSGTSEIQAQGNVWHNSHDVSGNRKKTASNLDYPHFVTPILGCEKPTEYNCPDLSSTICSSTFPRSGGGAKKKKPVRLDQQPPLETSSLSLSTNHHQKTSSSSKKLTAHQRIRPKKGKKAFL